MLGSSLKRSLKCIFSLLIPAHMNFYNLLKLMSLTPFDFKIILHYLEFEVVDTTRILHFRPSNFMPWQCLRTDLTVNTILLVLSLIFSRYFISRITLILLSPLFSLHILEVYNFDFVVRNLNTDRSLTGSCVQRKT